jgi:hypothetical protein
METAFRKPMHRSGSFSKKRRQSSDSQEENCASKKRRKAKQGKINVCPLGEKARREEQR